MVRKLIIVLMIIFNGSNISDESTPKPIKFLPKLSLVRCCVEITQ